MAKAIAITIITHFVLFIVMIKKMWLITFEATATVESCTVFFGKFYRVEISGGFTL